MLRPIDPNAIAIRGAPPSSPSAPSTGSTDFQSVFAAELVRPEPLRFSAHATQRLNARNIAFSPAQLQRAEHAVDTLGAKGARESLLLMDGAALVVSVPNRTVITAVSTSEMPQTVFTQIDSAVVVGNDASDTTAATGPAPDRGGLPAADRLMRRPNLNLENV